MVHWCDGGGNAGPQVALLVGLLLLLLLQRHGQQPGPGRGHQRARARVPAHRGRPRPRPAPAGQVRAGVANNTIISILCQARPGGGAAARPAAPGPGAAAGGRGGAVHLAALLPGHQAPLLPRHRGQSREGDAGDGHHGVAVF